MRNILFILCIALSMNVFCQKFESEYKYIYISKVPKPTAPAILEITQVNFNDSQGNNNRALDANEKGEIQFNLTNIGKGDGHIININLIDLKNSGYIKFPNVKSIPLLKSGGSEFIKIPIEALPEAQNGSSDIKISITEGNGFDADPHILNITTFKLRHPQLALASFKFSNKDGEGKIKLGEMVNLQLLIQNKGQGIARDITIEFKNPDKVFPGNENSFKIDKLEPNESKVFSYDFFANKQYKETKIPINVTVNENLYKYGFIKDLEVSLDEVLRKTQTIEIKSEDNQEVQIEEISLYSDVDQNIPLTKTKNPDRYAIIIGNEDYKSRQTGLSNEVNVPFAVNDARTFKDYVINLFGVEEQNVYFKTNATSIEIKNTIKLVSSIIEKTEGRGELIFYYAGHGYPEELTKTPYLIPVDVNATNVEDGINVYKMYKTFTDANPKKICVFLDACFSGGGRDAGLIAARGVLRIPQEETVSGNILIFSATQAEQTALAYKSKQHGMFTYHLLKKLKDSNGNISYGELIQSVKKSVAIESLKINQKSQEPSALYGEDIINTWQDWKINE